ncbi:MAG: hypothetical protein WKF47_14960 [Geodermatophilaceae bacterium]
MSHMGKEPDNIDLEGVPEEEGISQADAEERIDIDPDEEVNRPEAGGPGPKR